MFARLLRNDTQSKLGSSICRSYCSRSLSPSTSTASRIHSRPTSKRTILSRNIQSSSVAPLQPGYKEPHERIEAVEKGEERQEAGEQSEYSVPFYVRKPELLYDKKARKPVKRRTPQKTLRVDNLSPLTTEARLKEEFLEYGPITKISIVRMGNETSSGYGFVTFENLGDAVKAHENRRIVVNKRALRLTYVSPRPPTQTLHISNIPSNYNETQIKELFEPYGPLIRLYIAPPKDCVSLTYGFITYEKLGDAMQAYKGSYALGKRQLVVDYTKDPRRAWKYEIYDPGAVEDLHVSNIPSECSETEIVELFEPYGPLTRVKIVREEDGESPGIAFVTFEKLEDAMKAYEGSFALGGHRLAVDYSIYPGAGKTSEILSTAVVEPGVVKDLHITHIPPHYNETVVRELFEPYGPIMRFKLVPSIDGMFTYGFVTFVNIEDAMKAREGVFHLGRHTLKVYYSTHPFGMLGSAAIEEDATEEPIRDPSTSQHNTTLRVEGIPLDCNEEAFVELFERYGPLKAVNIARSENGALRRGFVTFKSYEDAAMACEGSFALDDHELSVRYAHERRAKKLFGKRGERLAEPPTPQRTLYVWNMSPNTGKIQLTKAFLPYGPIDNASIVKASDGSFKGRGFVTFEKLEDAIRAHDTPHPLVLDKRVLRFEYVDNPPPAVDSLHVRNIPPKCSDTAIMELFEPYGPIKRVKIIRDEHRGFPTYAFISFQNLEDSKKAYEGSFALRGHTLLVDYGTYPGPGKTSESLRTTAVKELPAQSTLYIWNLSFKTHEMDLKKAFQPYGSIANISIVRASTGKSRGRGFVTFKKLEDAVTAKEDWPFFIDGRILGVVYSTNPPRPVETLNISNISPKSTEHDLREAFSAYGPVKQAIIDPPSKPWYPALGHVVFEKLEDAIKAQEAESVWLHRRSLSRDYRRIQDTV